MFVDPGSVYRKRRQARDTAYEGREREPKSSSVKHRTMVEKEVKRN